MKVVDVTDTIRAVTTEPAPAPPAPPARGPVPRSALDGLRRLQSRRAGPGGGGRRPRPPKRGDAPGSGRIDLRNTWQIMVGSILVPLGIVFILIAWYGAAHTAYVQQQIPYLVSGSFVGLGCLVLGGLLYWAHWLYRIYDQADLHHEEQLRVLESLTKAIAERVGVPSPAAAAEPVTDPGGVAPVTAGHLPPTSGSPSYVVTPSGSVYHLPSCPVVAHHTEGLRVLGPGAVADLEPCRICLGG